MPSEGPPAPTEGNTGLAVTLLPGSVGSLGTLLAKAPMMGIHMGSPTALMHLLTWFLFESVAVGLAEFGGGRRVRVSHVTGVFANRALSAAHLS